MSHEEEIKQSEDVEMTNLHEDETKKSQKEDEITTLINELNCVRELLFEEQIEHANVA